MRSLVVLSSLVLALFASVGCATYRQDLERAQLHYDENRFEGALALLRVLEHDSDSLTPAQRVRYAYLRGMTDFRLSELAEPGNGSVDPKVDFRMNARHWLGVAAAAEVATPNSLSADEKARLDDTLKDLDRDVHGGTGPVPAPKAPAAAACKNDKQCPGDDVCRQGRCVSSQGR